MIFITLGTQKFQFDRLLKKIDDMKKNGIINEEIYAQIGESTYVPETYEFEKFVDKDDFMMYMKKADVIITHSGVGTIIKGLNLNKKVIVVPRLKKFKEHVDDHQLEIAKSFSDKNFVLSTDENIDNLEKVLKDIKKHKFSKYISSNENIQRLIINFIEEN